MNAGIIIVAMFAHWIGDFILQSDWMAINKAKSWRALGSHAFTVSCPMALTFCLAQNGTARGAYAIATLALLAAGVNGLAHFVIDAVTSRINARLWAAEQRHWFFTCIGFDQWLHVSLIFLTVAWLGTV